MHGYTTIHHEYEQFKKFFVWVVYDSCSSLAWSYSIAASLQGTGASVRRHSLPSLPCSDPLHSLGRRERVCMVYCLWCACSALPMQGLKTSLMYASGFSWKAWYPTGSVLMGVDTLVIAWLRYSILLLQAIVQSLLSWSPLGPALRIL